MSTFLRYILGNDKDIAHADLNWLLPVSFTAGMGSFYGMPWEIYRTDKILLPDDNAGGSGETPRARTVTFFTKGGGLPGYRTLILLVPGIRSGHHDFHRRRRDIAGCITGHAHRPTDSCGG